MFPNVGENARRHGATGGGSSKTSTWHCLPVLALAALEAAPLQPSCPCPSTFCLTLLILATYTAGRGKRQRKPRSTTVSSG